jgi:hypothetical protein
MSTCQTTDRTSERSGEVYLVRCQMSWNCTGRAGSEAISSSGMMTGDILGTMVLYRLFDARY